MINNKIKLHILRVPVNKLGNWLIAVVICMRNYFKRVSIISIKLNIMQSKLVYFAHVSIMSSTTNKQSCME